MALFFVASSWRKWPDPLVDFGRELYVPWRLANGALLYRDVDDIYGPLSQYLNAGLFALFGPGLMVLVAANLAIFTAIVGTLYVLFRRAWGAGAALVSAAVFVAVFGFSQFTGVGNYNYATPYSHEATHGFLACLLLVAALVRWLDRATTPRAALAGLLLGLTAVLKPEYLFAGLLVTGGAAAIRLRRRGRLRPTEIAAWAGCAAAPTAGFAAFFATHVPAKAALAMACRAWLYVAAGAGFTRLPLQEVFLGLDRPWQNLARHAGATVLALLVISGIGGVSWAADRTHRTWLRLGLGGLLAAIVLGLACLKIAWINTGSCLLGLTLLYAVFCAAAVTRANGPGTDPGTRVGRLLVAVLAAALMGRMFLNGRLYHYGFYQAALSALVVPAFLIGELPFLLGVGPRGRAFVVAGSLLLLVPGVVQLATRSQSMLRTKTYSIESGSDRFYTFPPQTLATGDVVRVMSEWLRKAPPGQTAVVLPEGEMINYLARVPSPVAPYAFFAAATADGREGRIVEDLRRHPPDWLVLVSRDMSDSGVRSYGETDGEGLRILSWAADHYEPAMSVGGDPLDPHQCGGIVFRRKGPDKR
jgi:hypothetical protein